MFGATDFAEFLIEIFDVNPAAVKLCSSAISVTYDMSLDLDIANPNSPHRGDGTAVLVRRAATFDKPAPVLMTVCWDVAIVRQWLVERGPLRLQTFNDLTHSTIMIARTFHAMRGSDLHAFSHTEESALDHVEEGATEPVNVMLWMTKTATRTCKETNFWRAVPFAPLRPRQLARGLKIAAKEAQRIVQACCLLRALAELRRRVLPALQQTPTIVVGGRDVWSKTFFLVPSTLFKVDKQGVNTLQVSNKRPIRYMARNSFNPIVKKIHLTMVPDGMPELVQGRTARHYRHVALTLMHRVGCKQEAKTLSTHTEGSQTYAKSYCIPNIDPDFERRFLGLDGTAAFTQLRACERLLL